MNEDETIILTDHMGKTIRLTSERRTHILEHPEMVEQLERLRETVAAPQLVVATPADEAVHVYQRHYAATPVTSKYLWVIVKWLVDDAFVVTAFFSSRQKKGKMIWMA
jgi:hypothetical protein